MIDQNHINEITIEEQIKKDEEINRIIFTNNDM